MGTWGNRRMGEGGSPRPTRHCVTLGPWFLALGGERQGPVSVYGAASRIPSEPGVLMPTLVLPVLSLFSERERTVRRMERETCEISPDNSSPEAEAGDGETERRKQGCCLDSPAGESAVGSKASTTRRMGSHPGPVTA